jgi:hypothetical protein
LGAVGAIAALLSIPGYPFWSLAVFALNILVVYGLVAYGGQGHAAERSGGPHATT